MLVVWTEFLLPIHSINSNYLIQLSDPHFRFLSRLTFTLLIAHLFTFPFRHCFFLLFHVLFLSVFFCVLGVKAVMAGVSACSVREIFETMSYGPAPEAQDSAQQWLAKHDHKLGHFIDGKWVRAWPRKGNIGNFGRQIRNIGI